MQQSQDLKATAYFLARDDLYRTVKPYYLEYLSDVVPRSNLKTHKVDDLLIRDLRGREHEFTFEENGFTIVEMQSSMSYDDFDDKDKIENIYCEELGATLLEYTGATSVQIFDTTIRRRHPTFPFSTVQPEVQNQPAVRAHVDSSPEAVVSLIKRLNGDNVAKLLENRYIYVNIWKPLKGPVRDWPLAICDACSINPKRDLRVNDNVFANVVRENMMVHYDEEQRWYYLSDHMPNELLVFRQVDSMSKPGVAHTSFLRTASLHEDESCRESIEARAILYFHNQTNR